MNCVINNTVDRYLASGRRLDVIARYIRMKYRIHIDASALRQRVKSMEMGYSYT